MTQAGRFILLLWGLLLAPAGRAVGAIPAEVEDMSDRAYFPRALGLLEEAKKSVHLSLYSLDIDPARPGHPGTQLADALVRAHVRGVSCLVVLNRDLVHPRTLRSLELRGHDGGALVRLVARRQAPGRP